MHFFSLFVFSFIYLFIHSFLFSGNKSRNRRILFPEYELLIETEPDLTDESEKSEKDRLDEYKQFVRRNELLTDTESDKELESLASLGKEALLADKQFRKFKKRITREPKQVCWRENCKTFSPLHSALNGYCAC